LDKVPGTNAKREYFESIAEKWDGFMDVQALEMALRHVVADLHIGPEEVVLDLGCGTGILTGVLRGILSDRGHIHAVDISPAMIEVARSKGDDRRITWHIADVLHLPLPDSSIDRAVCFSSWPHFPDSGLAAREVHRVLRNHGTLAILHLQSREKINQIHTSAGGPIAGDLLPPASHVAPILEMHHLLPGRIIDDDRMYLLVATKEPAGKP
jgi:demethylmenaquinone methyltransferase/2-methoxy-6-polyprenyl-1,4-benzoquinol methylase